MYSMYSTDILGLPVLHTEWHNMDTLLSLYQLIPTVQCLVSYPNICGMESMENRCVIILTSDRSLNVSSPAGLLKGHPLWSVGFGRFFFSSPSNFLTLATNAGSQSCRYMTKS